MSAAGTEKSVTRLAAMPFGARRILAVLAAVGALGAAGCGSGDDKSIPPTSSDQLLAQLQAVRDEVRSGDCELAKSRAIQFKGSVDGLPADVQSDTKHDLNQLADNLIELANDPTQCVQEGVTGETGATSTDTSTTEEPTTTTTTSSSTTEDTTTKPEEEQPAQPEQQPSGEGSQGDQGGSVSGNINGGGTGAIGIKPPGGGGGG